jgi:hypothetical protein
MSPVIAVVASMTFQESSTYLTEGNSPWRCLVFYFLKVREKEGALGCVGKQTSQSRSERADMIEHLVLSLPTFPRD